MDGTRILRIADVFFVLQCLAGLEAVMDRKRGSESPISKEQIEKYARQNGIFVCRAVRLKGLSSGKHRLTINRIGYDLDDPYLHNLEVGSHD